ncbi:MAG: hypothetical protein IT343_12020, partial [Candidatus Melainabacteria bacterium]|nr:hypothetical protein [Candidatus Melainabacteria bacterium]
MSDLDLTRADKAQETQFIIETAFHLEAANGRFFNKLSHRDKDGDPNTIDKDDLKEALKLDDRKREFSRGFLSDTERKSVTYMLKHWDDEKFKVLKDDLFSSDSEGQEFRHQGFSDISRRSVERVVSFYAQPIPAVDKEARPPAPQKREQQSQDAHRAPEHNRGHQRHAQEKSPDCLDAKPAKEELSRAEIIKNTQAYLSGKGEPKEKEEYKPFISQSDAVKDEMRRRQIFAMTPTYSTQESFHPEPPLVASNAQADAIESEYTFRDGVHDALSIAGSLTDAATPFLMWDLA